MLFKKNVVVLTAGLLVMILALAGCGGKEQATDKGGEPAKTYNLSMSLGGTTGVYYRHGSALADYINQNSKVIKVVPATSGGGQENVRRVGRGEANLGLSNTPELINAWNGTGGFEKLQDLRFLGAGEKPIGLQIVALKKSGIKTLEDLVGKRVVLGAPGATARVMAENIFKEKGLLDKVQIVNYGHEEIPDKLKDGDIAAFGTLSNVPVARISEIAATDPVWIIDLAGAMKETDFLKKYPFYEEFPIKANSYKGLDQDVMSFGMPAVWFTNAKVPEEAIYEFMKLAYSEEGIKALSVTFRDHDHDSKEPLKNMVIPLHPGALKFWKEKGIAIPEPKQK